MIFLPLFLVFNLISSSESSSYSFSRSSSDKRPTSPYMGSNYEPTPELSTFSSSTPSTSSTWTPQFSQGGTSRIKTASYIILRVALESYCMFFCFRLLLCMIRIFFLILVTDISDNPANFSSGQLTASTPLSSTPGYLPYAFGRSEESSPFSSGTPLFGSMFSNAASTPYGSASGLSGLSFAAPTPLSGIIFSCSTFFFIFVVIITFVLSRDSSGGQSRLLFLTHPLVGLRCCCWNSFSVSFNFHL